VAEALRQLVGGLPDHPAIVPVIDVAVSDGRPFIVVASVPGEPLDAALRTYGPAAMADAFPRLRRIADALDVAATHRRCHGALTPRDIIISADDTTVVGIGVAESLRAQRLRIPMSAPYAAPELATDVSASPLADQYALAAIAHEWLFGRVIDGPADDDVNVPALQGVNTKAMGQVFTRALAREPADRFESSTAFITALERGSKAAKVQRPDAREPRVTEVPKFWGAATAGEISLYPTETAAANPPSHKRVFVGMVIGGIALGLSAVWWVMRPGVQHQTASTAAGQPFTDAPLTVPVPQPVPVVEPAVRTAADDGRRSVDARSTPDVARAARSDAGLLVHSTPAGAIVRIDGVEHGLTPVAVRGLAFGTRTVVVSHTGYRPSEHQVTLTRDRPSRTLEVGLVPAVAVAPPRPITRETGLVVDSRPAGAAVSIDGRPVGVTPLTLAVAPGIYSVRIERAGYRTVTSRVEVAAGQRPRLAVRLEGGQVEK
jgi:hypothetical protein